MKKIISKYIMIFALATTFSNMTWAFITWEDAANFATGGAYGMTKETANQIEELLKELESLKNDLASLIASIEQLGSYLRDTVSRFAQLGRDVSKKNIDLIRTMPDQIANVIQDHRSQLERDVNEYRKLVAQFERDKDKQSVVRDEMQKLGRRMQRDLANEQRERGIVDKLVKPVPASAINDASCNTAEAHEYPANTLGLLAASTARMRDFNQTIHASLKQPVIDSTLFATSNLESTVQRLESSSILALESIRSSVSVSLPTLRSHHATIANLILEPWNAVSHALDPLRDAVATAERTVNEFHRQTQAYSDRLYADIVNDTLAALNRSAQQQYQMREYYRLNREIHDAAVRAVSCGDRASTEKLRQTIAAQPRPPKSAQQLVFPQLDVLTQPPKAVVMMSPAVPVFQRAKAKTDRVVFMQRRVVPEFQQAYQRIAVRERELNKQMDALFRNKSPQEISMNRAQVINTIRARLGGYPHLMNAAVARLDTLIRKRTAVADTPRTLPVRPAAR